MSIPEKEENRTTINRSYDIYVDQNDWLVNSPLNKSKTIRGLLDNFINEVDATVIENLRNEINIEKKENETLKEELVIIFQRIKELTATIEEQKSVIVAMGGE